MVDTPWAPNMIGWGGNAARMRHNLIRQASLASIELQFAPDPDSLAPGGGSIVLIVYRHDKPVSEAPFPEEQVRDYIRRAEETLGENQRVVRGSSSSVEGVFRYKGDYPKRWIGEKSAYVCGSWCRDWAEQRHRIETHDPEKRVIAVAKPYHYYGYKKGHWFYGFNILAELDRPGEWYIDRDAGVLYFWPPCPIGKAKVEVSMAPSLIRMNGTSHVTIKGLVLESAPARSFSHVTS